MAPPLGVEVASDTVRSDMATCTSLLFWPGPEEPVAREWAHFEGRLHMQCVAKLWSQGLRYPVGPLAVPQGGVTPHDVEIARYAYHW